MSRFGIVLLLLPVWTLVAQTSSTSPKPTPYVSVYHNDDVLFQVRRDRIMVVGDDLYRVWLRWLWAEPRKWKNDEETSTMKFVDLDCSRLRVRELAALHKNRAGKIFDTEEWEPDEAQWMELERDSGAGAAMERVCEFVPKLIE